MTHILAQPLPNQQADEALRRAREDDARHAAGSPGTGPSLAAQAAPLFNDSWQCTVCGNHFSNRQTSRCTVCN